MRAFAVSGQLAGGQLAGFAGHLGIGAPSQRCEQHLLGAAVPQEVWRGGEYNKRNANKIMRYRLGAQFVAVLLILLFIWVRSKGA